MKNPLGQVKFVRLFKITVLNLHVIMMKPEIIGWTNVNLLYLPDSIEIASLEGLMLWCPEINKSKTILAW